MGRKTKTAANEHIVFERNGKRRPPCNEETVVINFDGKNGAESTVQSSIPTLWSPKYTKSGSHHRMWHPIPGVTPEFAEDSDVEVSGPTIQFRSNRNGCELMFESHSDIKKSAVHRRRRFMYGNERLPMTKNTMTYSLPKLIKRWYSQAVGFDPLYGKKIIRSPIVDASSLFDITGVYIYCPRESADSPPMLRFLRAPVDYSHNRQTAALYGLSDSEAMITRTSEWSLESAWKSHDCSHVRFINKETPYGLECDWDAMALITLRTAGISIKDLNDELGSDVAEVICGNKEFPEETRKFLRVRDSFNANSDEYSQVLLPRVFPVFTRGDMPSMCDIELSDNDAKSNIKRLLASNRADNGTYSHSLNTVYTSTFFSLWLKAVFVDSDFFSGLFTTFKPHQSGSYADSYGSMLVARRIGWDILYNCCNNPNGVLKYFYQQSPDFNMECDRKLVSYNPHTWPRADFRRFLSMPKFDKLFPDINEEMTIALQMKEASQTNGKSITREYACKADKWLHCIKTGNRKTWKKELELCYSVVPENMPSFFYHPDTYAQMITKKEAAFAAYKYLQDIYIKKNEFDGCIGAKWDTKYVFEGFRKFLNCLRTFHSLTVQYKCNGFAEKYKDYKSSSCPLGDSGKDWRMHHGLQSYTRGSSKYTYPMQNCKMCNPVASCSVLLHLSSSDDHLHQAVGIYVSYCSQYLPQVTHNILVDTGNKEFRVRDSRVHKYCSFKKCSYPNELQNDYASDVSNLHEKATDSVTTNKAIIIEDDSSMSESSGAKSVNDELLPDSRRHNGHVHRNHAHIEQGTSERDQWRSSSKGWAHININDMKSSRKPGPVRTNYMGEPKNVSHGQKWSNPDWETNLSKTWRGQSVAANVDLANKQKMWSQKWSNSGWRTNMSKTWKGQSIATNVDLATKQKKHDQFNRDNGRNNNSAHSLTCHNTIGSQTRQDDRCNHPNTVHKSSSTKVAQNNIKRRQRHRRQEEKRLENDAYSLDAGSNSVKGKRNVNQSSNESTHQNVIVDLIEPTQRTILANDGTFTHPVISSDANPELLNKCLNVIATYVHQTQNGNTPAMLQALNTSAMSQAVNTTLSSTQLNIVAQAGNKKKKYNESNVRKRLMCGKDKPVLFEGKQLFLLEDVCDQYRCASNGKEFKVQEITTDKFGTLPIVVWKDDDRDKTELVIHAWKSEKSRRKHLKKRLKLSQAGRQLDT